MKSTSGCSRRKLQPLGQPPGLGAAAVAVVGRGVEADVVGVQAEHAHVAVDERVDHRAVRRPVAGEREAPDVAAVAIRRVQRLHVVVAHRDHPRHLRGHQVGLAEELVPQPRVERVGDQAAAAARVGDVARVQVERRALAQDPGVVDDAVVALALVAEGGEGERLAGLAASRAGGERRDRAQPARLQHRVEALVPHRVVVGPARVQVVQRCAQVVLLGRLVDVRGQRGQRLQLPGSVSTLTSGRAVDHHVRSSPDA